MSTFFDVKVVHAFEIALHAIRKSFVDQFDYFIVPDLLCRSATSCSITSLFC